MKPMMGLFEIIFYEGAFWSYMELNVFKINFWKLYVSIEGAPNEELFYQKQVWCSTVITFKCHNVRQ